MSTKGYQTYRGRTPLWKKILIIALLLVLLVAGGGMLMSHYVVFDENGAHIQLPERPEILRPDDPQSDLEEDVVIDVQEPEVVLTELHGKTISAAILENETLGALDDGVRPVFVFKNAHQEALYMNPADRAAVQNQLDDRGAIVRISCFADHSKASAEPAMAILTDSGKLWKDSFGRSWLNPYETAVADYIAEIAVIYAQMGVSEIVLDDIIFPVSGAVHKMHFGTVTDTPEKRAEAVALFVKTVSEKMDEYGVAVSVAVPASLLRLGTIDSTGLDLEQLAQWADRVYADAENQSQADANREAIAAYAPEKDAAIFYVAQTYAPVTGGSYILRS